MSGAAQGQLVGLAMMIFFIGLGVSRRVRRQPVRPNRIAVTGVLIVLLIAAGLLGTGGRIVSDPVALVLIPVFVAAGIGLGFYLVRSMTFWVDPETRSLWMRGGALFAVILIGTIVLRFGLRAILTGSISGNPYAFSGSSGRSSSGLLYDISADLLFLSLGLWASRAFFLVQRHRSFTAGQPVDSTPPSAPAR